MAYFRFCAARDRGGAADLSYPTAVVLEARACCSRRTGSPRTKPCRPQANCEFALEEGAFGQITAFDARQLHRRRAAAGKTLYGPRVSGALRSCSLSSARSRQLPIRAWGPGQPVNATETISELGVTFLRQPEGRALPIPLIFAALQVTGAWVFALMAETAGERDDGCNLTSRAPTA
jgi:hypothetical protein